MFSTCLSIVSHVSPRWFSIQMWSPSCLPDVVSQLSASCLKDVSQMWSENCFRILFHHFQLSARIGLPIGSKSLIVSSTCHCFAVVFQMLSRACHPIISRLSCRCGLTIVSQLSFTCLSQLPVVSRFGPPIISQLFPNCIPLVSHLPPRCCLPNVSQLCPLALNLKLSLLLGCKAGFTGYGLVGMSEHG